MRHRAVAVALALAGTVLLGCGDDGGDDAAVTTTAAPENVVCGGDAADAAPAIARAELPGDPDRSWTVLGSRQGGLGMVLVEVTSDPEAVDGPSLTFVFACGTGQPEHLATYALDGDEYVLLSTTDAAAGIDFAPVLEE